MMLPSTWILIASLVLFAIGLAWGSRTWLGILIKGTILLLSLYGFYLTMYLKGYVIHIGG